MKAVVSRLLGDDGDWCSRQWNGWLWAIFWWYCYLQLVVRAGAGCPLHSSRRRGCGIRFIAHCNFEFFHPARASLFVLCFIVFCFSLPKLNLLKSYRRYLPWVVVLVQLATRGAEVSYTQKLVTHKKDLLECIFNGPILSLIAPKIKFQNTTAPTNPAAVNTNLTTSTNPLKR